MNKRKHRFKAGDRVRWVVCLVPGPSTGQEENLPPGTGTVIYVNDETGLDGVVKPDDPEILKFMTDLWEGVDDECHPEWRGCICFSEDFDEDEFNPVPLIELPKELR